MKKYGRRDGRKGTLSPGDGSYLHGSNGYSNYRCRCDICKEANRISHYDYMRDNTDQQRKNRDRQRKSRGLPDSELIRLEEEYQRGKHRGGRTRVE